MFEICLTLKMPRIIVADDTFNFSLLYFKENKTRYLCESSAWQRIHMKCQALFFLKTKKNFQDYRLLQL